MAFLSLLSFYRLAVSQFHLQLMHGSHELGQIKGFREGAGFKIKIAKSGPI